MLRLALIEEVRARGAGRHGVDGDALGREVLAHDAGHLLDGPFGGVVEEVGRLDGRGGALRRGEEDDVGALGHVGYCFLFGDWSALGKVGGYWVLIESDYC